MSAATGCLSHDELADYWTADLPPEALERLEAHVFECASCARLLADAESLRHGVVMLVRAGAFQAFVTDALLNRLSRDGVRVRTYSLGPGESVACAAWEGDDVILTRLRGDFTGVTAVEAVMRLESGEEIGRSGDVPVSPGATELLLALPGSMIREAPAIPMRLTLRAQVPHERVLAEYTFDHGAAGASGG